LLHLCDIAVTSRFEQTGFLSIWAVLAGSSQAAEQKKQNCRANSHHRLSVARSNSVLRITLLLGVMIPQLKLRIAQNSTPNTDECAIKPGRRLRMTPTA
jgi:hypothetical protein